MSKRMLKSGKIWTCQINWNFVNLLQNVALSLTPKSNKSMCYTKTVVLFYFMDKMNKLLLLENTFIDSDI